MANETKIRISAETAQAQSEMGKFGTSLDGIGKKIMGLSGIAGALSFGVFTGKLIGVQREFDILNSSLITVTGSSSNAAKEFAWIKEFAATTPYQLADVTGAFVKMKALGLDASRDALTSYGNTASAMGKNLNQMIEAVADAATGEFERLKEFGIKASKNGDDVSLTFRGVTTTIRNSASEITGYLQDIGNNDFAGAMALRTATLDGAISNLADTWDGLFRTISSGDAGGIIYDGIKLATGAVEDLDKILGALNDTTKKNASETGAMKLMLDVVATVFETVTVLGVNLKYVLVQIGNEIGGIAAQSVAILSGNFAEAGRIRKMMVEDAKAARAEVDATSARILNARSTIVIPVGNDSAGSATSNTGAVAGDMAGGAKGKKQGDGTQVLLALELDYQNTLAKRRDALNAPLLSASEKALADDLREVHKRAQDARVELEKQSTSGAIEAANYSARLAEVTAKEQEQVDAVRALQAAQDQLNGSWEYGANVAMRHYIDEANNTAKQSESLFGRAFHGMSDELAKFVQTGKMDFASLRDSIIADLLRIQMQKAVAGVLGSIFVGSAGSGYGDTAGVAAGVPSYDGGGSTGMGARSGGLDGKGGFVAMLHPQETVIDHTKGQSQPPSQTITLVVNVTSTTGNPSEIKQAAGAGAKQALAAYSGAGRYA